MQLIRLIGCLLLLLACDKKPPTYADADTVEIYVLSDFNSSIDASIQPAITVLSNARISNRPLVTNEDILFYTRSTHTFKLRRNIKEAIKDFGADKAFAVTVNRIPVYLGTFHPSYLSSIRMGIATIDPFLTVDNEIRIDYFDDGSIRLKELDKRNTVTLTNALFQTGRLR